METVIVITIIVVVGLIGLRGFIRTAQGKGGCGGSCACSSEKKQGCGGAAQEVQIMDQRQK